VTTLEHNSMMSVVGVLPMNQKGSPSAHQHHYQHPIKEKLPKSPWIAFFGKIARSGDTLRQSARCVHTVHIPYVMALFRSREVIA